MGKSTGNRQSLTMPIQETARAALKETETSASPEMSQASWNTSLPNFTSLKAGQLPPGAVLADQHIDSRRLKPPFSTVYGMPSQSYATGSPDTTPPRLESPDASRPFFSNLKAAQSGTIIPEPSGHKFTQDSSSTVDGRKPSKSKSTPDFKAESRNDPVPDLPLTDPGNQCKFALSQISKSTLTYEQILRTIKMHIAFHVDQ